MTMWNTGEGRQDVPEVGRMLRLPKIIDDRGNLSFIEESLHIPFKIARAYWIYDVPGGEVRGSHAFRRQEEFIVAISGSFDVVLDDGASQARYPLNRSYMGVYVPPMTWRTLENFSTNSLCLVLSSMPYDPEDYIWDYEAFRRMPRVEGSMPLQRGADVPASVSLPSTVYGCNIFELPKVHNRSGNLTALNNRVEVPFDVKRVYYTYDIPSGAVRGGHAHRKLQQYLVAAGGSFDVLLDDGNTRKLAHLDRPDYALHIVPGIWRELLNFSSCAVCLVLASEKYDEADYIRHYDDFIAYKRGR